MKQIFVPSFPFSYNAFTHSSYLPVLKVDALLTHVSVSRATTEIGQIAITQAVAIAGTHTLKVIAANQRFIVKEVSIVPSVAGRFSLLDGVNPFVYGSAPINGQFRYLFGGIGYLSTADGNDLVIRNETGAVCTFEVTVTGYVMALSGTLSRF